LELARSPAAMGALLINLAPLAGVLAWGWKGGALVVLYWLENIVVGVVNVARMASSGVANGPIGLGAAVLTIPFFCVHFGMFCLVHGMFVLFLFADVTPTNDLNPFSLVSSALAVAPHMAAVIGMITIWKVALFVTRFIGGGEFRRTNPAELMMAPYGRIVFIHIAIFAGAFALAALGQPIIGVIALVVLKAAYDVLAEANEERRRLPFRPVGESAAQPPR
jgi:hypothetical protein